MTNRNMGLYLVLVHHLFLLYLSVCLFVCLSVCQSVGLGLFDTLFFTATLSLLALDNFFPRVSLSVSDSVHLLYLQNWQVLAHCFTAGSFFQRSQYLSRSSSDICAIELQSRSSSQPFEKIKTTTFISQTVFSPFYEHRLSIDKKKRETRFNNCYPGFSKSLLKTAERKQYYVPTNNSKHHTTKAPLKAPP